MCARQYACIPLGDPLLVFPVRLAATGLGVDPLCIRQVYGGISTPWLPIDKLYLGWACLCVATGVVGCTTYLWAQPPSISCFAAQRENSLRRDDKRSQVETVQVMGGRRQPIYWVIERCCVTQVWDPHESKHWTSDETHAASNHSDDCLRES